MQVKLDIGDHLMDNCGDIVIPVTVDADELIEKAGIPEEIDVDIHDLLSESRAIAQMWDIKDVQKARSDLDDDQAWQVLETIDQRYDRDRGVTWETIEAVAEDLFGPHTPRWHGLIHITVDQYSRTAAIEHFTSLAEHIEKIAVNGTTRATFDSASLQADESGPANPQGAGDGRQP